MRAPAHRPEAQGRGTGTRLVREQLADGPKPGAQIEAASEAAEIPDRALTAAAADLGVRTRKGQWWIAEQLCVAD